MSLCVVVVVAVVAVVVVVVAVGGGGGDGGGGDVGGGSGGVDELITPHHQASLANVPSPRGSFNSCSEVTFKEKDKNQLLLKFKQVSQNHPIPG